MTKKEKLSKWAPLLSALFLGMLIAYCIQFFIAGPVPLPTSLAAQGLSSISAKFCLIQHGPASTTKGIRTEIRFGKSLSSSVTSALGSALDLETNGSAASKFQDHLTCEA